MSGHGFMGFSKTEEGDALEGVHMSRYDIVSQKDAFQGLSYGQWAGQYWNWLVSKDVDEVSPYSPVVFLRGNDDGYKSVGEKRIQTNPEFKNEISISEGTAIFFPVIESEYNNGDVDPYTGKTVQDELEMRTLCRRDIDEGGPMDVFIENGNGESVRLVENLKDYRAESPLFKLHVSHDNELRKTMEDPLEPGDYDAVTAGYWVLIKSLPPEGSPYVIRFNAEGRGAIHYAGKYTINVTRKSNAEER